MALSREEIEEWKEKVKNSGDALKYASKDVQNNPEIVMEAVKKSASSLKYASEELRNNPDIVITAVTRRDYYGGVLQYAGENAKNNPEVVLEAVKHDLRNFQYAGKDARNNEKIILEVIEKNKNLSMNDSQHIANPMKLIGEEARNNPKIIKKYIENTNFIEQTVYGKHMKKVEEIMGFDATDYEVIMKEIIKKDARYLKYEGEKVQNNPEIVMEAVKKDASLIQYAGEEIKNNPEIIMEAVKKDASLIQYAGEEVKNNPKIIDIMMEAVKKDANLIQYAGEEIKNNPEIVMEAVKKNASLIQYAGENFIMDNADYVINLVRENNLTNAYDYGEKLQSKFNIAKKAIIDGENIDKNTLNNEKEIKTETINSESDYFDIQYYDGDDGVYYRANGNTKLFEVFDNGQVQLLTTIRKGEFIPVDSKNLVLEFLASVDKPNGLKFGPTSDEYMLKKIIPLKVCDEIFKRCVTDEEYREALNELGYKVPDNAHNFKENIIEPEDNWYGIAYGVGLSKERNEELLQGFFEDFSDGLYIDDFVDFHLVDLMDSLGRKRRIARLFKK